MTRPVRGPQPARFYPIVPNSGWLARIVPLGIGTVQLRLKDASPVESRRQIAESLALCRTHGVQLIVNDDWRAAINLGADYIHLGQEDLAAADLAAIKSAGIKLGLSTHNEAELEVALAAKPDYIALGPIYETKLKAMSWAPQGLEKITAWKQRLGPLPLVAIGGLTPERAPNVVSAGAQSLAVITDFVTHPNPERRIREWVALAGNIVGL